MKQRQHDINLRRTRKKKSESQMGFEPTTLRDLVGCSNSLTVSTYLWNSLSFFNVLIISMYLRDKKLFLI